MYAGFTSGDSEAVRLSADRPYKRQLRHASVSAPTLLGKDCAPLDCPLTDRTMERITGGCWCVEILKLPGSGSTSGADRSNQAILDGVQREGSVSSSFSPRRGSTDVTRIEALSHHTHRPILEVRARWRRMQSRGTEP